MKYLFFSFVIIFLFSACTLLRQPTPPPSTIPLASSTPSAKPSLDTYSITKELINDVIDRGNVYSITYSTSFEYPSGFTVDTRACDTNPKFCYVTTVRKDTENYMTYTFLYPYSGLGGGGIVPKGATVIPLQSGLKVGRTPHTTTDRDHDYTYMGLHCATCSGVTTQDETRNLTTGVEGIHPGLITIIDVQTAHDDQDVLRTFDALVGSIRVQLK
jgi:hypothetical protein